MASNTAQTHKFAPDLSPAWLKLPTIVTQKTPNDSSADNTQYPQQTRRHTTPKSEFDILRTTDANTDNSCSQRITTNHDSSHYLNSRHSLADDDQYHNLNGHSIASNVIASRYSKSKYNDSTQRPNFRHDYRDKTDYHSKHNAEYKNYAKKQLNAKSVQFEEMGKKANSNEENCNVFNQEFPSLIDDTVTNDSSQTSNSYSNSAWNNNAAKSKVLSTSSKSKVQLVQRSAANFDNDDVNNKSEMNAIISNSLKQNSTPVYRNLSLIGKTKIKENGNIGSKMMPIIGKTNSQTSPAMEILVKNPKLRANKSDFLKSIRSNESNNFDGFDRNNREKQNGINSECEPEDNKSNYNGSEMGTKHYDNDVNAVNNCCDNPLKGGVLSSSLEAEHRFLMELGWKQDDDPSYAPLTEDEVNEFKDLVNARNGFKRFNNSLNNQALHLNLSSKKTPPLTFFSIRNEMLPNSDDESSSSSSTEDN